MSLPLGSFHCPTIDGAGGVAFALGAGFAGPLAGANEGGRDGGGGGGGVLEPNPKNFIMRKTGKRDGRCGYSAREVHVKRAGRKNRPENESTVLLRDRRLRQRLCLRYEDPVDRAAELRPIHRLGQMLREAGGKASRAIIVRSKST